MQRFIVVLITLFSFVVFAKDFEEVRKLNLSVDGIKELEAECGAGSLEIQGVKGLKEIEVEAEIVLRDFDEDDIKDFIEDRVRLELKKVGKRAYLESTVKSRWGGWGSRQAYINVSIKVPYELDLVINDGSGSISIEDVGGNVDLEDGSGSITIEGVGGDLRIDDGSGSITVEKIAGEVDIEDGSGSIDIYDVAGKVIVDDGSGGIKIDKVDNDVLIKESGSGNVRIRNVTGHVEQN